MSQDTAAKAKNDDVTLEIATPNGSFKGVFENSNSVAAVIAVVVADKGLDKKDTFELIYQGSALLPDTNTLKSFGLHGTKKLTLVAQGTGV
jgi:hypothetical protein